MISVTVFVARSSSVNNVSVVDNCTMLNIVTIHAFDRRTDGQTDRQTDVDRKTARMHSQ